MDWKEKITIGMKLIAEGCREAEGVNTTPCYEGCPFTDYCDEVAKVDIRQYKIPLEDWDK